MTSLPDVPTKLFDTLKSDAGTYGHGVATLIKGEWVRINPSTTVIVTCGDELVPEVDPKQQELPWKS